MNTVGLRSDVPHMKCPQRLSQWTATPVSSSTVGFIDENLNQGLIRPHREDTEMAGRLSSPEDVRRLSQELTNEVAKVVVGYEETIAGALIALAAGGHVLLEGVPGIAKTTLSKAIAHSIGIDYGRIQFTQDLLPSDITGHMYFNQETRKFEIRKGPVFTELLLADEINRAPPKTQSALLEAMQEKQVTIEGNTLPLSEVFTVLATLNPVETEGVYPLPEAQVDRFMLKLTMPYPNPDDEIVILNLKSLVEEQAAPVMTRDDVLELRKLAFNVHADFSVLEYIKNIAQLTREMEDVVLGLSPRGGIHLLQTAKAHALMSGRSYVIPDDVKAMAHKVIDHRLIVSPEYELGGGTVSGVTEAVLSKVPVPKESAGTGKKKQ
jgi:MoxR-like ATPase